MVVRIGMAPRAAGLSIEDCQRHWRTAHAAAALGIPGLRAYTQNHAVLDAGRPLLPYPGFDVCAETQFDSLEAMDAAFASAHYRGTVRDDETQLIDGTRFRLAVCARRVLVDGSPPGDAVKLMTFLRADGPPERLADVLADGYAAEVAALAPARHEQLIPLAESRADGRVPPVCDAVDVLWFATAAEALDAVHGALSERAGWRLAGHAFGSERLLARPHRVR